MSYVFDFDYSSRKGLLPLVAADTMTSLSAFRTVRLRLIIMGRTATVPDKVTACFGVLCCLRGGVGLGFCMHAV